MASEVDCASQDARIERSCTDSSCGWVFSMVFPACRYSVNILRFEDISEQGHCNTSNHTIPCSRSASCAVILSGWRQFCQFPAIDCFARIMSVPIIAEDGQEVLQSLINSVIIDGSACLCV